MPRAPRQGLRPAALAAVIMAAIPTAIAAEPDRLPSDFVYLRDVAPTIEQTILYATDENFTGRPVPGYEAGECVLLKTVALALSSAQADLEKQGFRLRVYDCYRPARAVRALVDWARHAPESQDSKRYHPRLTRKELLAKRYIAEVSGHSLGIAVDLTLVKSEDPKAPSDEAAKHSGGCRRPSDGSVDMGTEFDCFDIASHVGASGLSAEQQRLRTTLATALGRHGFKGYAKEWWHFTWQGKAGEVRHDFAIKTHPAPPAAREALPKNP